MRETDTKEKKSMRETEEGGERGGGADQNKRERVNQNIVLVIWGRYHGGRRPSSDDSFHSPTVIPPSALNKPECHEALPSSSNDEVRCDCPSGADDGMTVGL